MHLEKNDISRRAESIFYSPLKYGIHAAGLPQIPERYQQCVPVLCGVLQFLSRFGDMSDQKRCNAELLGQMHKRHRKLANLRADSGAEGRSALYMI